MPVFAPPIAEFPTLQEKVQGKRLVYLDNAATTQKPQRVIDALTKYYRSQNANVHRGAHTLAARATDAFEHTRDRVKSFLNANRREEIIFTRGTTEAINLLAFSFSQAFLKPGDEVLITAMEHHSNIVPWQLACERHGATLRALPLNERGELRMDLLGDYLSEKTKLVAFVHISNALGTINPAKEIIARAHAVGAKVLVDGAQSTPHGKVDVQDLDCDFFAFSGHKMYGPTGIGGLYGKYELLNQLPPYHGGGEMIRDVNLEKSTWNDVPYKFEAGTPNIADTVALAAAIDFIEEIGQEEIAQHEADLLAYGTAALAKLDKVKLIGTAKNKAGVLSFLVDGVSAYDLGLMLNTQGIAIRTGHHCAQPIMQHFGVEGTARASLGIYNTEEDIDIFVRELEKAIMMLS